MIRHIRLTALLSACLLAITAWSVNPYPQLRDRAQRAFDHEEWASASALLDLMLEEKPTIADTYGQAIVANAMRNDTTAQMRLMQKALDNYIPFDSVFSRVRQWSFSLGKTHLLERFLKDTRSHYPWLQRTINGYLLKYYTFRRNGQEMVVYSNIMLSRAPENAEFLTSLAEGYMLLGMENNGVETYCRILDSDPDNLNALLSLGNLYADRPDTESHILAVRYLERAYALHATPYVAARLRQLGGAGY
ncbi:MAG: hypothetical protein HDS68_01405 [Bacteroidales bacterium]|nr:hypothetical protein [Bacteroidales bacterium]